MKNLTHLSLILLALLLACNESIDVDPDSGFEIFTISSGQHSSIVRTEEFQGQGINVIVRFDESAAYTLQNPNDQADINKLVGFSDCGQHHQSESARFGWRWYEDELQILAYAYLEGDLSYELMGAIPINQDIDLSIAIEDGRYLFSGTGLQSVGMPRTGDCETGEKYWLWPYFGGNEPAPHTVRIELKREVMP